MPIHVQAPNVLPIACVHFDSPREALEKIGNEETTIDGIFLVHEVLHRDQGPFQACWVLRVDLEHRIVGFPHPFTVVILQRHFGGLASVENVYLVFLVAGLIPITFLGVIEIDNASGFAYGDANHVHCSRTSCFYGEVAKHILVDCPEFLEGHKWGVKIPIHQGD